MRLHVIIHVLVSSLVLSQCNQKLVIVNLPGMKQMYCTDVAASSFLAVGPGQVIGVSRECAL